MSNFGGAGGAEYEFITQDHATSIQMKLAWRAYLERNISRSPDFICLDMSSAHRKTRPAWLAGKSAAAPRRASPRGDTQDTQHKCTVTIKLRSQSRWSVVARRTRSAVCRASTLEARARNSFLYNECVRESGKALSEFRARSRRKAPTPCTNEAFTSTARQDGFLERGERAAEPAGRAARRRSSTCAHHAPHALLNPLADFRLLRRPTLLLLEEVIAAQCFRPPRCSARRPRRHTRLRL